MFRVQEFRVRVSFRRWFRLSKARGKKRARGLGLRGVWAFGVEGLELTSPIEPLNPKTPNP